MRPGLMPLIVIVTAVIGAGPSRSEEARLADKTPDGARLIDLYKAARTVADVEAANGKVKDEVLIVQSVATDLHGCPVEFWWTRRMAFILLFSERLATCRDTEGDRRHAASE